MQLQQQALMYARLQRTSQLSRCERLHADEKPQTPWRINLFVHSCAISGRSFHPFRFPFCSFHGRKNPCLAPRQRLADQKN